MAESSLKPASGDSAFGVDGSEDGTGGAPVHTSQDFPQFLPPAPIPKNPGK